MAKKTTVRTKKSYNSLTSTQKMKLINAGYNPAYGDGKPKTMNQTTIQAINHGIRSALKI